MLFFTLIFATFSKFRSKVFELGEFSDLIT